MQLSDAEVRVLGVLIEKEMTTPEYYPLTMNALIAGCNQSSNRDPVVSYDEDTVHRALEGLRHQGLSRTIRRPGQRALRFGHAVADTLGLEGGEAALLAVLMLRGSQTVGELRLRTERYTEFAGLDETEQALFALADRGLVEQMERRPGQKEARYRQLLSAGPPPATGAGDGEGGEPAVGTPAVGPAPASAALRYFRERLAFETEPGDVHADLGGDAMVVIDTRPPPEFGAGHVPGARSLPHASIGPDSTGALPRDRTLVVCGSGPLDSGARKGAAKLAALGFQVKEMLGGMQGWRERGYPVEASAAGDDE